MMEKKGQLLKGFGFCLIIIMFLLVMSPVYAAEAKVIELSFAHTVPEVNPLAKVYAKWGNMVAERTGGRVKINHYYAQSLLKAPELFRGVQTGVADMSYYVVGLDWGLTPLNSVTKLGLMGFSSTTAGTEIYHKLWDKFPEMRDEFKGVKVLASRMAPPNQLNFTKKEVRVPADMKGLKMIALGGSFAQEMAMMGAAPMDVKVGDMYMSLDRGLADGIASFLAAVEAFGCLKLVPKHTFFQGGVASSIDMVIMNVKKWKSLPPDVQKVFEELRPNLEQDLIQMNLGFFNYVVNKAKEMGHTFIYPNPDEVKLWKEVVRPSHEKWISENEAKGLPARAIYEETQRLIKEYSK